MLIHLVHQIEDLKLEARHKDEKIKILGEEDFGGGEEEKLSSRGVGEFGGEGKGKFGDGVEVELGGGEEGLEDWQTAASLAWEGVPSPETSIDE